MRNMEAMMSAGNAEWAMPQDFFDKWNASYQAVVIFGEEHLFE